MSWAADYIGLPWRAGAQGPDAYNCWGFFRHVQAAHFGVDVPPILVADEEGAIVDLFTNHPERQSWAPVDVPRHGDAVMVRRPLHVGVWLDDDGGGVLHCVKGIGVVFTRVSSWPFSGFGRRTYYRRRT